MNSHNERLNTARTIGSEGCDYVTSSATVTFATVHASSSSTGWYGFYVASEATVSTVTFKNREGKALTLTPTWKSVALPAGCWIPAGRIPGASGYEDAYIATFAVSAGKVILYCD